MSINDQCAAQEPAGVRALREAKRKTLEHMGSASKELGSIAAQYGRLIDGYAREVREIEGALAQVGGFNDKLADAVKGAGINLGSCETTTAAHAADAFSGSERRW